jgi:serine/threonine protein kinase
MLDERNDCKIIDFGLATVKESSRTMTNDPRVKAGAGTRPYQAPELLVTAQLIHDVPVGECLDRREALLEKPAGKGIPARCQEKADIEISMQRITDPVDTPLLAAILAIA